MLLCQFSLQIDDGPLVLGKAVSHDQGLWGQIAGPALVNLVAEVLLLPWILLGISEIKTTFLDTDPEGIAPNIILYANMVNCPPSRSITPSPGAIANGKGDRLSELRCQWRAIILGQKSMDHLV